MITKEAQDALETAKQALSDSAQQGGAMSGILGSIGDSLGENKGPALSALIGAILGGTAGGGMSLLSGEGGTVGNTLTGGALGALTAGAGHLGHNYLSGRNNPGGGKPTPLPWSDRANNAVADSVAGNLGGLAGGAAGTALAIKGIPTHERVREAARRAAEALKTTDKAKAQAWSAELGNARGPYTQAGHYKPPGSSTMLQLAGKEKNPIKILQNLLLGHKDLRNLSSKAQLGGHTMPRGRNLLAAAAIPAGAYAGNALQKYLTGRD